jgi:hypothetical protein
MTKSQLLYARAIECEHRAREMPDFVLQDIFLDLANQWRRLAGELDTSRDGPSFRT